MDRNKQKKTMSQKYCKDKEFQRRIDEDEQKEGCICSWKEWEGKIERKEGQRMSKRE